MRRPQKAFHALDTTNDDEIHYSDFLAAMASTRVQLHDELLRETFRRFDYERDGYIHMHTMTELLGNACDGREAEQMLQDAGVFKDGKIAYEDWIKLLHGEMGDSHKIAEHIIDGQGLCTGLEIIPNPQSAQDVVPESSDCTWLGCCVL